MGSADNKKNVVHIDEINCTFLLKLLVYLRKVVPGNIVGESKLLAYLTKVVPGNIVGGIKIVGIFEKTCSGEYCW